ncbi:hypothetical protein IFT73_04135 [Aeromicrobium sp. CFBP 8757]|uniref:DUF6308 family protein n=1 Tax=Aeromicrobium sp. CFBP 8757 TaxID=2775288 RepID=UPI00178299F1|nr:DUF6308 family protein [Aeromicrobium sp. CFBP 8757]MBD8606033.1 hypothetical protein [Aeromicrobium sp. CFBP 8757]
MTTSIDHNRTLACRIRGIVADHGADLVSEYYANGRFAGNLFDGLGENPVGRFTSDDLLAASLLDVRFEPRAVRGLVSDNAADTALAAIPADVAIWDGIALGAESDSMKLWQSLRELDGIGPTRASKLMARKRPHLYPILDSVVRRGLGLVNQNAWLGLQEALADGDLRADIDGLWTGSSDERPSTLRLLDVAVWMRHSGSRNAKQAREAVGVAEADVA